MNRCILALVCLLLAACAAAPVNVPQIDVWRDDAFAATPAPISPDDVFALSDEMRAVVAEISAHSLREPDPRRQLVDMLYRKHKIMVEYDSSSTRTAAQTYAARSGNCLSLVIMTSALAKALGLPVYYQQVLGEETWSRSGTLYVANGHVNISLEWRTALARSTSSLETPLVIDFLPPEDIRGQRTRTIGENTILAMFMNNRAAEAMARADLDSAYGWARAAVAQDPAFLQSYNTLAVIYLRRGLAADAEKVLTQLLVHDPENPIVMGNLEQALRQQGREQQADGIAARLARIEPYPPFYWFRAGLTAMQAHDYANARELFTRELQRDPDYHEFHFWLAQAEWQLGHVKEAERQLERAMRDSTTRHDHDLYAAKLDRIKALQAH